MKLALRSLGLMEGDIPTNELAALVDAYDTPNFDGLLLERLKATYPYLFALDLTTATPTMFADAFNKATGAKEDVSRKGRTFFLHAAKKVGIPLGTRILAGSATPRPPSNGGIRRKPKPRDAKPPEGNGSGAGGASQAGREQISDKALEYKLVDLMKEDGIEDAERSAIWTLIQYLTAKAKASAVEKKTATDQ